MAIYISKIRKELWSPLKAQQPIFFFFLQIQYITFKINSLSIPEGKEVVHAGFCLAERPAFPHLANSDQGYPLQVLPSLGEVSFSAFFVLSKTLSIVVSGPQNKSNKTLTKVKLKPTSIYPKLFKFTHL